MKILICTNHSYMFWQFRKELTEALVQKGEVILSTPFVGHEEDLAALGCKMVETKVDRRGINPKTDWKLLRFYWNLIKQEQPDLVITYSIKPNIYASLVCRVKKLPYCVNVQGLGTAFQKPLLSQIVTMMYKVAVKKAKTVFFENEGNAKLFREKKIMPASQQTVLSGAGVNLEYYAQKPYPIQDQIHFLYLGRIMKEKGMDELFQAVRKLKENYQGKFILDLVGFFEDEYKDQVEELVADGSALFHGFQSDPRPYYEQADCVVLPSYHEGMSNVLLEAAATGRVVITSDIPGCREAVEDNRNGFLCKVKDCDDLYQKMESFLKLDQDKRKQMGEFGREKIKNEFAKELVVKKTVTEIWR